MPPSSQVSLWAPKVSSGYLGSGSSCFALEGGTATAGVSRQPDRQGVDFADPGTPAPVERSRIRKVDLPRESWRLWPVLGFSGLLLDPPQNATRCGQLPL